MTDEEYMERALALARRGLGKVSPNPMVGAVIVKNGRKIGEGYHRQFGDAHAEVIAIDSATEDVSESTMYITLEPCCHQGKTPPCTEAIIKKRIKKVVIGMLDPDSRVSGRSVEILRGKGIDCTVGTLEDKCRSLNETYIKHRSTGLPFVTVKFAQTLDGRIASSTGHSRWISSPASRKIGHRLRARNDAILAGVGNVLADDPELTTRLVRGRNPLRVILDSNLRIPDTARVLSDQDTIPTLLVTTPSAGRGKLATLRKKGIEVSTISPDESGRVDIRQLLKTLGERQISSLLVEGGGEIITSFLRLGAVDRLVVFIAPKILGKGIDSVNELDIRDISLAIKLHIEKVYRSGEDIAVEARVG
jgi:diaminohydroxyphosphoribosylaminopyrimidine deaminase/5-amino-6-(5-phosphoribosylamino)uracil reductase